MVAELRLRLVGDAIGARQLELAPMTLWHCEIRHSQHLDRVAIRPVVGRDAP